MDYEDVKEWYTKQYTDPRNQRLLQFDVDCVDWLMAEVERLKPYYQAVEDALIVSEIGVASGDAKKDLNLLAHSAYEEGRFFTAKRCAEIVDEKGTYNDQCDRTIEAIRKEFLEGR